MKNYGIILASGMGKRCGNDLPKQFAQICGKTVLEHTIEVFEKSKEINEIIVVITPEYRNLAQDILNKNNYKKVKKLINGGEIRKDSSYNGISAIEDEEANVLIHDCARPFLTEKTISNCISSLALHDAVVVAIPAVDTIYQVVDNKIKSIPKRSELMQAQTPQCFKLSLIRKAHELSLNDKDFTDDCALVIKHNLSDVFIVLGTYENRKITYKSDLEIAQKLFEFKNQ